MYQNTCGNEFVKLNERDASSFLGPISFSY